MRFKFNENGETFEQIAEELTTALHKKDLVGVVGKPIMTNPNITAKLELDDIGYAHNRQMGNQIAQMICSEVAKYFSINGCYYYTHNKEFKFFIFKNKQPLKADTDTSPLSDPTPKLAVKQKVKNKSGHNVTTSISHNSNTALPESLKVQRQLEDDKDTVDNLAKKLKHHQQPDHYYRNNGGPDLEL